MFATKRFNVFLYKTLNLFFLAFILSGLSSCQKSEKKILTKKSDTVWTRREIEARLHDIPFFVQSPNAGIEVVEDQEAATMFTALLDASLEHVAAFYRQEMDWFDWQLRSQACNSQHVLFYYEKPQRFCSLVFYKLNEVKTKALIATGLKEKQTNLIG